jgi:hypothetical protein
MRAQQFDPRDSGFEKGLGKGIDKVCRRCAEGKKVGGYLFSYSAHMVGKRKRLEKKLNRKEKKREINGRSLIDLLPYYYHINYCARSSHLVVALFVP